MKNKLTQKQKDKLAELISYSHKYRITIYHWPENTQVYISKDGISDSVDLIESTGDFDYAINKSLEFLNRINKK